ncbi:3'-5' exonuclease [Paracoccus marcusii]|uniref:3'-5' exonuclease n=1 Tax=Paracoccus marcusii TaxID=59779 RepID=UPI002ED4A331|nr:3'-5' exonuclease [Paracoccus marcusii]
MHSAKGQEWRSVHILNAVDGCIPSDLGTGSTHELEEERRLLYVAMTRAKDHLTLGLPQRFYVTQQTRNGDRHVYAIRTRFIPGGILDRFEAVSWSPPVIAGRPALRPHPSMSPPACGRCGIGRFKPEARTHGFSCVHGAIRPTRSGSYWGFQVLPAQVHMRWA